MLENKVIIITGAGGGIGKETVKKLNNQSAKVVLADINLQAVEKVSEELKLSENNSLVIKHDVSNPDSWNETLSKVLEKFGRIDILINNAGIVEPGFAEEISIDKIKQQIHVNFLGTVLGCRTVIPQMKARRYGQIINIASLGGIVPMPGEAVYSGTKYAIRGFSLSLRAELQGTGIVVSVICPDSVETPQLEYEATFEEAVLSFVNQPLKPQKIAATVLKVIKKPKPEILVPGISGFFLQVVMSVPTLFFKVYPIVKKIGARGRQKRLRSSQ